MTTTTAHNLRRALFRCVALALGVAAPLQAGLASGAERPVRVTIQAQPRFEQTRTSFAEGGAIDVSAQLVGDTGGPVASAEVGVALRGAARGASVGACVPGSASPSARGVTRTDDDGRLCVRVSGASASARIELTFAGDDLHLPATAALVLQPAPALSSLAFDAPSVELDLDQPTLRLRLGVSTPDDDPLPAIELELHDAGRVILLGASEWSREGNTLAFSLDTSQLGAPGPARLVARQAGSARGARAEAIALRVARVRLGARVSAEDEDGAALEVWTETRVGPAPNGWVEVTGGDGEALASAPFARGHAELRVADSATGEVTLQYHSDDPWWLPGAPLVLSLEPATSSAPRRWPWLALLAPIGYICLRSLQRPAQRKTRVLPPARQRPPTVSVEASSAVAGWVGSVVDAHDGQPIAGALVQATLPSFRGDESNTHATLSDARGWFELPPLRDPLPEGARLRIWAPLHSEVDRPLPPHGRVSIALTTRRRAVLRRLVRWARGFGAPWFRGPDPTPGEIASIAARRGDARTARWAESVQAAAYGGGPVDEAVESALREAEPPWHQASPRGDRQDDRGGD